MKKKRSAQQSRVHFCQVKVPDASAYASSPVLSSAAFPAFLSCEPLSESGACFVCRLWSSGLSPVLCHDACRLPPPVLATSGGSGEETLK